MYSLPSPDQVAHTYPYELTYTDSFYTTPVSLIVIGVVVAIVALVIIYGVFSDWDSPLKPVLAVPFVGVGIAALALGIGGHFNYVESGTYDVHYQDKVGYGQPDLSSRAKSAVESMASSQRKTVISTEVGQVTNITSVWNINTDDLTPMIDVEGSKATGAVRGTTFVPTNFIVEVSTTSGAVDSDTWESTAPGVWEMKLQLDSTEYTHVQLKLSDSATGFELTVLENGGNTVTVIPAYEGIYYDMTLESGINTYIFE